MEKKICRRCLLDEIFKDDEYENMQEYIRNIDKHIKTDDDEYRIRLGCCKKCDNLVNGMCKLCGCFVEMRAAVKKNYCPDSPKKW